MRERRARIKLAAVSSQAHAGILHTPHPDSATQMESGS
jgi:hypothetical protein